MLFTKTSLCTFFVVTSAIFSGAAFGSDSANATMTGSVSNSAQKESRAMQNKLQFIDEDCDGINDIIQNRERYPNTFGDSPATYGGKSGAGMFSEEGVAGKRGARNSAAGGSPGRSGRR